MGKLELVIQLEKTKEEIEATVIFIADILSRGVRKPIQFPSFRSLYNGRPIHRV